MAFLDSGLNILSRPPSFRQFFIGMAWNVFGRIPRVTQFKSNFKIWNWGHYGSVDQVHVNLIPCFLLYFNKFPGGVILLYAMGCNTNEGNDKDNGQSSTQ